MDTNQLLPLSTLYSKFCAQQKLKPNTRLLQSLKESPHHFPSQTHLDFSKNYFGPMGVKPVIELLRRLRELESTSLAENSLDNESVEYLTKRLRGHPSLHTIDLSSNPSISLKAADLLLDFIENNPLIMEVYLDGTSIHAKFRQRIEEALMKNKLRRDAGQGQNQADTSTK